MIDNKEVIQITNLNILGLYGKYDFKIRIKDNRIIFVAYNGAYKSTVLRIIYLFLSVQLDKLDDIQFDSIEVLLKDGKEIKYKREEDRKEWYRKAIQKINKKERTQGIIKSIMNSSYPIAKLDEYILKKDGNIKYLLDLKENILKETIPEFANLTVLYLPTYRKIEQDFENIYEGIEYISQKNTNSLISDLFSVFVKNFKIDLRKDIEVEDSQNEETDDSDKEELKSLEDEELRNLPDDKLERLRLFANIYEEYSRKIKIMKPNSIELTEFGMQHVKELIEVTNDKASIEIFIKVVNQYFIKDKVQVAGDDEEEDNEIELDGIYKSEVTNDKASIEIFIKVVNQYFIKDKVQVAGDDEEEDNEIELDGIYKSLQKEIIYSDNKISLKQMASGTLIDIDHLSSGEKQIVTLFAYLILSGDKNFFVLFDEPELSLSVLWQENILDDILKLNSVKGLIAATHSPNVIKKRISSARDLTDFMEEKK
jgi:energy-coupling factor transporter ATP-binding protein EcfA2